MYVVRRYNNEGMIPLCFPDDLKRHFGRTGAELRPGLNPSPCNRQFDFERICLRSRAEVSARAEIRHVIGP